MMISFNDNLVWFCRAGEMGCITTPQWVIWIFIYLIVIAFGVGFFLGRRENK